MTTTNKRMRGSPLPMAWCALSIVLALPPAPVRAQDPAATPPPPGMILWESATAPVTPPSPELLEHGRRLYAIRCALCHGEGGRGDGPASDLLPTAPRDFTRGPFKFRTTTQDGMPADLDLFRSITAGFPAYGMPSFRYLGARDRWALVYHVKTLDPRWDRFGPPEPVVIGPEPAEDPQSLERGRVHFETTFDCVQCHGLRGRGDGPRAAELRDSRGRPAPPRDFSRGRWVRKAGWRPLDTVRTLITGLPGTPMPSQVDQLPDPADLGPLWDVGRYVDHLMQEGQQPLAE